VPAPRNLQPVSPYVLFILQNHRTVPSTARAVWATLLLSWKRSEVIPINSPEIPSPGIKDAGVQAFTVASVCTAPASIFLYLLKGQKNGFRVVVSCCFEDFVSELIHH